MYRVGEGSLATTLFGVIFVLVLGLVAVIALAGKRIRQCEFRAETDSVTGALNSVGFERKTRFYKLFGRI